MGHRKEKRAKQRETRAQDTAIPPELMHARFVPGYYGSGGSFGYGGGFEHPDYPERESKGQAAHHAVDPGWYHGSGPMDPSDAYGGFGSSFGDHEQRARPRSNAPTKGPYFGSAPQGYTRSDDRIREDVCDLLMYGHVDPRSVSVAVSNGEVTLDGRVERRRDKYVIEEFAASVLGVREVVNRLRVGGTD